MVPAQLSGDRAVNVLCWAGNSWHPSLESSVMFLTSSSPVLCSATAKMPETHSASPPQILSFPSVMKQSNFSMYFLNFPLSDWLYLTSSFFLRWIFFKEHHWKLKWACYFLSHSLDKPSLPLHTNSWFTGMLLKYVEEIQTCFRISVQKHENCCLRAGYSYYRNSNVLFWVMKAVSWT